LNSLFAMDGLGVLHAVPGFAPAAPPFHFFAKNLPLMK